MAKCHRAGWVSMFLSEPGDYEPLNQFNIADAVYRTYFLICKECVKTPWAQYFKRRIWTFTNYKYKISILNHLVWEIVTNYMEDTHQCYNLHWLNQSKLFHCNCKTWWKLPILLQKSTEHVYYNKVKIKYIELATIRLLCRRSPVQVWHPTSTETHVGNSDQPPCWPPRGES